MILYSLLNMDTKEWILMGYQHLKDATSCQVFKKCLKTHLFRLAHWGVVDYDSNYDNVQRLWTFY